MAAHAESTSLYPTVNGVPCTRVHAPVLGGEQSCSKVRSKRKVLQLKGIQGGDLAPFLPKPEDVQEGSATPRFPPAAPRGGFGALFFARRRQRMGDQPAPRQHNTSQLEETAALITLILAAC